LCQTNSSLTSLFYFQLYLAKNPLLVQLRFLLKSQLSLTITLKLEWIINDKRTAERTKWLSARSVDSSFQWMNTTSTWRSNCKIQSTSKSKRKFKITQKCYLLQMTPRLSPSFKRWKDCVQISSVSQLNNSRDHPLMIRMFNSSLFGTDNQLQWQEHPQQWLCLHNRVAETMKNYKKLKEAIRSQHKMKQIVNYQKNKFKF